MHQHRPVWKSHLRLFEKILHHALRILDKCRQVKMGDKPTWPWQFLLLSDSWFCPFLGASSAILSSRLRRMLVVSGEWWRVLPAGQVARDWERQHVGSSDVPPHLIYAGGWNRWLHHVPPRPGLPGVRGTPDGPMGGHNAIRRSVCVHCSHVS